MDTLIEQSRPLALRYAYNVASVLIVSREKVRWDPAKARRVSK